MCPNVLEIEEPVSAIQFAIGGYLGLQEATGDLDNFIYMFSFCFWLLIVDELGLIYAN